MCNSIRGLVAVPMAACGLFLGLGAAATPAAAQTVPLPFVAGNPDIARQIIHGDAHLLILGDSIQNYKMIPSYLAQWHPDRFSGQVIAPNLSSNFGQNGVGDSVFPWFTAPWIASSSPNQLPDQPASADGLTGIAPGSATHVTFAPATVPISANLTSNRFLSISLDPGQQTTYAGGPWAYANDGKVNIDLLLYSNPQGLSSGMRFDVRGASDTDALAGTPLTTYSATAGLTKTSLTFTYQPDDPGAGFSGEFRMADGITPAAGSNFVFVGARVSNGLPGLQIANLSQGSKGVDYFLSTDNVSDENLAQYINLTDSNIAYIWIGTNDTGKYDKAQWKVKMQDLLARYRTARPGMEFVLVSNYDLGRSANADFAQDLYEISQESSDVLFLNLYSAAGSFSFLDQNYLVDHLHPTAAGDAYFAGQVWSLLERAAVTRMPEPGSAALLAVGALLLLPRRQSRHARATRPSEAR